MRPDGLEFEHETLPQRVHFSTGGAVPRLRAELERYAGRAPMVIAAHSRQGLVSAAGLGAAARVDHVRPHVPAPDVAQARALAEKLGTDLVVAVGGGSAIGLAKAVALTHDVLVVAVPTTFAGSEATPVWGITDGGHKRTGTDPRVLPASVVYDTELVAGLPVELTVQSGLNAVAHCVESMWAPRADPINAVLALAGLRALRRGLPDIVAGRPGQADALLGCHLAGAAFASAGSGMHHRACHVLGGTFGLPHAGVHSVVLPYVLAFYASFAGDAVARLADALDANDAVDGLEALRTRLGAPRSLQELGFAEADVAAAATAVHAELPARNPRPVSVADVARLLHAAWRGDDPRKAADGR